MPCHVLGGHRADFLEDLAPFLVEQLVAIIRIAVFAAGHEAGVVADVVREGREKPCAQHFEGARRRIFQALDQNRRADITKDEMTVAVLPRQMRRGDFRVDHQHGAR